MLKVECESCKAPYQVDERRVPPTGLKMRCPKCGHTFKVTNPNAPAPPAAAAAPPAPAGPAPRPAPAVRHGAPAAAPQAAPAAPAGRPSGEGPAPISGRRAPTITGLGYGKPSAPAPMLALPDVDDDPFAELPVPKAPGAPGVQGPRGGSPFAAPPAPSAPGGRGQATPLAPSFDAGNLGQPSFGSSPFDAPPPPPALSPRGAPPRHTQPPPFGSPTARGPIPGLPSPDDDPFALPGASGFGSPDDPLGSGFGSLEDLPMAAGGGPGLPSLSSARSPLLQTKPSPFSRGPAPSPPQAPPPFPPPAHAFAPPASRGPLETRDFGSDFGSLPDLVGSGGGAPLPAPGHGMMGGFGSPGDTPFGTSPDFGALDDDLPMPAAELPAARRGPPGAPPAPPVPTAGGGGRRAPAAPVAVGGGAGAWSVAERAAHAGGWIRRDRSAVGLGRRSPGSRWRRESPGHRGQQSPRRRGRKSPCGRWLRRWS